MKLLVWQMAKQTMTDQQWLMEDTLWKLQFPSHAIMDTKELDLFQGLVRTLEHGISKLQHAHKVMEGSHVFFVFPHFLH